MLRNILITYYLFINTVAFVMYGIDKCKAKAHKWRVPEKTLIGISFLGGGFGAFLGMKIFHHKTKHLKFQIFVPLAIILHVALLVMGIIYFNRFI